ncbi:AI-2E family transporter [Synechococcus sp. PCC 7336]|uniref:AI-2E family transporter n=1 Tax=Synechococcus sp. PCC 7336 TaxID=195250 RepID=UPI00034C00BE|nr:AI-2E family transporter [Synechococcus sp. PCC 7336]
MKIAQWAGLIALCAIVFLLWQVRQLAMLLFAGIVLSVALDTLARVPQRYGIKRGPALAIAILTVLVGLTVLGLLVVPPLVDQIADLTALIPDALRELENLAEEAISRLSDRVELPNLLELFNTITPQTTRLIGQSLMFLNSSLNIVIGIFLVGILTILLLLDPASYTSAFVRIFPAFYRPRIRYILHRCDRSLRGWVVGIVINSLFIAILSGLGLWALGVPLVLAHATIAGLLNFIPNIGPTLSVLPPLIVALTVDPLKALGVIVLYIILQNIETGVLTPLVMARQVSLLPGLILLAQLFFASFFGFLGLFLALPLAAVLQVWLREVVIVDVLDRWHSDGLEPKSFEVVPAFSDATPLLARKTDGGESKRIDSNPITPDRKDSTYPD